MNIDLSEEAITVCLAIWADADGDMDVSTEVICSRVIEGLLLAALDAGCTEIEEEPDATDEEVEAPPPRKPLNLEEVERLSKEEILKEAPKDRLVELCGDDEQAWLALGITYKAIPPSQWGTAVAERLFLKTLETVRRQA